VSHTTERSAGTALLFAGPHGAGKDTLENRFRLATTSSVRVVRHITRPATPGEVDGHDYHFVDTAAFEELIAEDAFLEHATYPDCMAGTTQQEVTSKLAVAEFANLATNLEEGLTLYRRLGEVGLASVCFFVSPVARKIMHDEPDLYIAALRARMLQRGRPDDRIENKLVKAGLYREMYFENEHAVTYIDNSDGRLVQATTDVMQAALASQISE
jgi:guanylate kinase